MLAIFHCFVVALYLFTAWYDFKYLDINIPKHAFLTVWCLVLQILYFTCALINDVIGTNASSPKNPAPIREIKDTLFGFAFPLALFVTTAFWTLYFVDKDLIFPDYIARVYPAWVNHVMHTLITVFTVLECAVNNISFPLRKTGTRRFAILSVIYLSWLYFEYVLSGQFPYPFLNKSSQSFKVLFLTTSPLYAVLSFLLCEQVVKVFQNNVINTGDCSSGYTKIN